MASAPGLEVGEVLAGRYELVEEIGRGGFGVVYRATQLGMNRDVAVKLLHATGPGGDSEMRERFKREAMMARNLNHPHTIRQYDFGETDDGMMYLVLEFLDGENLVEMIRATGALGDDRVRRMAAGVLKSLSEAHAQGIVHRDLKPANIMLCNVYGERDYVKVLDFGIAKTVMGDTDLTQAGVALGSPRYMAPELLQGENPTPASDVYAVAITFAEAITGKPLVKAENSVEAARMQLMPDRLPIPDELKSSSLWPWLSIALEKQIDNRYASAEEMLKFLSASPEELANRGADFGELDGPTTQLPDVDNSTTQPREQPNLGQQQPRETPEDDPNAPTMRIDGADVDAFLEQQGFNDPALDETDLATIHDEDLVQTNPSQDALDRPTFENALEDNRMTNPLPSVTPSQAQAHARQQQQQRQQHQSDHHLELGASPGDEAPTQMVSLDEANQAFDEMAKQRELEAQQQQQAQGYQASPQQPGQQRTATDGSARTEMVSLDEVSFDDQNRPSPQISGQAFTPQAAVEDHSTKFVSAVDKGGGMDQGQRKKYLIILVVVMVLGLFGLLSVGLLAYKLLGDDSGELQEMPTPTPSVEPTVANDGPDPAADTPKTVEYKIFTDPDGAAIFIEGKEKGSTPAKFSLPSTRLPLEVELKLDEYKPRTIALALDGDTTFDLKLEREEPLEAPEPEPKDEPAADSKPTPKPKPKPKPRPKPKPKPDKPVIDVWD